MNKNLAIWNFNSIFMNICMQKDYNHITCSVDNHHAEIDIYDGFHSPRLQNLKKEIMAGCTDGTSFEFRHFEKDEESESFSVLEITWEF